MMDTLPTAYIQHYYDRLGSRYDWFEVYEGHAKERGRALLSLQPGLQLLNIGVGTGKEHQRFRQALSPGGTAFALDLSTTMLSLTHQRTGAPVCQADARALPYSDASFERVYCAYVLDVLPIEAIYLVIAEIQRVLCPQGQVVLISLTEGTTSASRALVALWKASFRLSPAIMGGCRPVHLEPLVIEAGLEIITRNVIIQLALPSEVILARKKQA